MSYIILIAILLTYLSLTVTLPASFIWLALFSGGLPLGWLAESRSLLTSLKGMNAYAVVLLIVSFGSFIVATFNFRISVLSKCIPHAIFIAFCALSLIWAQDAVFGIRMFAKLCAPLLFFIACSVVIDTNDRIRTMERAIFIGGIIALSIAVSSSFFGFPPKSVTDMSYLTIPGVSPAPFSFYMGCVALLALAKAYIKRNLRYVILFLVFSTAVLLAFTRISIFGFVFAVSLFILLQSRSLIFRIGMPTLIIAVLLISFLAIPQLRARMFQSSRPITSTDQLNTSNIKFSGRMNAWQQALRRYFLVNPIMGAGLGATQAAFYGGSDRHLGVLHSEYLRLLCEVGLIGFSLFILALLYYAALLFGLLRENNVMQRNYATLAISSLLFFSITLMTDNSFDYVLCFSNYVFCFIAIAYRIVEMATSVNINDEDYIRTKPIV